MGGIVSPLRRTFIDQKEGAAWCMSGTMDKPALSEFELIGEENDQKVDDMSRESSSAGSGES
jgi:hypothetical protein